MRSFSRYQQPPMVQSTFDLKQKPLNASRGSFNTPSQKNPQLQLLKLPALNSMRRSASSLTTERNTKFKLQSLQDKLEQLKAEVHNTRLEAQETFSHIGYLRESLAVAELGRVREDLKKQVRGLQRLVKATEAADEERNRGIRDDCTELWNQTELLRQTLFDLRMRTQKMDERMGFNNRIRE